MKKGALKSRLKLTDEVFSVVSEVLETGKSTNHSGEVLAFLEAVKIPDFDHEKITFNQRIKQIREELK